MNHTIKTNCPECNAEHKIQFIFYSPDDGDTEIKDVVCKCGCEFENQVKINIEIDFEAYHPLVTKTGIKPPKHGRTL